MQRETKSFRHKAQDFSFFYETLVPKFKSTSMQIKGFVSCKTQSSKGLSLKA